MRQHKTQLDGDKRSLVCSVVGLGQDKTEIFVKFIWRTIKQNEKLS